MPSPNDQQALSAAAVLQPAAGGGQSGAVNALVQQAEEQQAQMTKLLQTIEQLQQENAVAVQQATQSVAGGVTGVVNKVVGQIDKQNKDAERKSERIEDRQFQEDFARLQSKLQDDARQEALAMGASIQAQRESMTRFLDEFATKKASFNEALETYSARTDEMLSAGFFDSEKGRAELRKRYYLIDMAKANGDDHFDDRHLNAAYRLHNENVQTVIEGGDPMDLSNLTVNPVAFPVPDLKDRGQTIAPSVNPAKMFEMKLMSGYPKKGVVFNDEPNFGLPEGYSPRVADAETMLELLSRDDMYRFATDASVRRELTRKNQEVIVQAFDRLEPLRDQYNSFNTTFNAMAPPAVERAITGFLAEENPHKFDDVGRRIVSGSLREIFGGGTAGEQMAVRAMELFDGSAELTTPEDAMIAMALESATFNIREHLMSEIQSADKEGSLATQLVRQMIEQVGEDGTARMLGVRSGAVGLVDAQDVMQGKINESFAFANRLHGGLNTQSALEDFRKDLRKFTRMADIFAFKSVKGAGGVNKRIIELMGKEAAFQSISEGVEAASPDSLEALIGREPTDVEEDFGMLDTLIQLSEGLGADQLTAVSAMLTGGVESPESPDLQAYLDNTLVDRKRSGYVNAAAGRARFNFDRQNRARQNTVGESFEKGGAPQVVAEQVPALLSIGASKLSRGLERGVVGTAQFLGGKKVAEETLRGIRGAQEQEAGQMARLVTDTGDLTKQEVDQVLKPE